jgi:hypothetical protein
MSTPIGAALCLLRAGRYGCSVAQPKAVDRTHHVAEGERAVALLAFANYSAVATALGVSRTSVARWAKGEQVTPWQLSRLEQILGTRKEEPQPEWAEALVEKVDAIRSVVDSLADNQAGAIVSLGEVLRRLPLPDDDPAGDLPSQQLDDRHDQ